MSKDETNEEWRDIPGLEGFYEASSNGRIRSVERIVKNRFGHRPLRQTILKQSTNDRGYSVFNACKHGKHITLHTHRLIAQTFIPNPDEKTEVNHINGIKSDNRVSNLEWATRSENIRHSYDIGLRGIKRNNTPSPSSEGIAKREG